MPVYDYRCRQHGLFNELQTTELHDRPVACPQCGQLSARIVRLPPELLTMPATERRAHDVNEQACHEPVTATTYQEKQRTQARPPTGKRNCGCGNEKGSGSLGHHRSSLIYTAQGEKTFPSQRPWMISH